MHFLFLDHIVLFIKKITKLTKIHRGLIMIAGNLIVNILCKITENVTAYLFFAMGLMSGFILGICEVIAKIVFLTLNALAIKTFNINFKENAFFEKAQIGLSFILSLLSFYYLVRLSYSGLFKLFWKKKPNNTEDSSDNEKSADDEDSSDNEDSADNENSSF